VNRQRTLYWKTVCLASIYADFLHTADRNHETTGPHDPVRLQQVQAVLPS
jgi:hypothetical protein